MWIQPVKDMDSFNILNHPNPIGAEFGKKNALLYKMGMILHCI
jgi:hypothetical protein